MSDEVLIKEFEEAMLEIYKREKDESGRNSTYFLQMISNDGGLKTAKKLLNMASSEGLSFLWERNRLDISMEALVAEYDWGTLFTPDEKDMACQKLKSLKYKVRDLGKYVR